MSIGKTVYPALALALLGLIIPNVPSAPSAKAPRPGKVFHPILLEHPPSPFKMPKLS